MPITGRAYKRGGEANKRHFTVRSYKVGYLGREKSPFSRNSTWEPVRMLPAFIHSSV